MICPSRLALAVAGLCFSWSLLQDTLVRFLIVVDTRDALRVISSGHRLFVCFSVFYGQAIRQLGRPASVDIPGCVACRPASRFSDAFFHPAVLSSLGPETSYEDHLRDPGLIRDRICDFPFVARS